MVVLAVGPLALALEKQVAGAVCEAFLEQGLVFLAATFGVVGLLALATALEVRHLGGEDGDGVTKKLEVRRGLLFVGAGVNLEGGDFVADLDTKVALFALVLLLEHHDGS